MINSTPINDQAIGYSPLPYSISQDAIAFDGYGLQNASIQTVAIDYDDLGKIDLATFDFPRDDGGGLLSRYYRGRQVQLRVNIFASSQDALSLKIDEIKSNLSKSEGNLDILVAGETRRIKATVSSIKFDRKHYNITFVQGVITFNTSEAFFHSVNDQSWLFEGRGTDFWEEITQTGSTNTDPRFYYIFGSGTSASQVSVTCKNRVISIARTFSAGDVLVIDCDNKAVTHNNTQVEYAGMFPLFTPGSNPFRTVITGSALIDLTVIAAKNYL